MKVALALKGLKNIRSCPHKFYAMAVEVGEILKQTNVWGHLVHIDLVQDSEVVLGESGRLLQLLFIVILWQSVLL